MDIGLIGKKKTKNLEFIEEKLIKKKIDVYPIILSSIPGKALFSITEDEIIIDDKNFFDIPILYLDNAEFFWSHHQFLKYSLSFWKKIRKTWEDELTNFRESESARFSILKILNERKLLINPLELFILFEFKPYLFELLKINGIPIPPYIISNKKEELFKFIKGEKSERIYLSIQNQKTYLFNKNDIDKLKSPIPFPILLQRYFNNQEISALLFNSEKLILNKQEIDSKIRNNFTKILENLTEVLQRILGKSSWFLRIDGIIVEENVFISNIIPSPDITKFEEKMQDKLINFLIQR